MHVAVGFMPAFKYRQKNSLIVFERGHKAHGYVSAGKASKIPTGGPPMTTRLSVTGDLLIWTGLVIDRRYSAVCLLRAFSRTCQCGPSQFEPRLFAGGSQALFAAPGLA